MKEMNEVFTYDKVLQANKCKTNEKVKTGKFVC